jgi:agmatinase
LEFSNGGGSSFRPFDPHDPHDPDDTVNEKRLTFLENTEEVSFDEARIAVFPVPFEATVSYGGGTARGPAAILTASKEIESFNEQMAWVPGECGIWTDEPLPIPDSPPEQVVRAIESRFGELMDAGKWVVMLGGEHGVTPGGVAAAAARHDGLHVVQLDAHADLRETYRGEAWSHACAMSRCIDRAGIRAIGIRSYSPEEADRMRRGIPGYSMVPAWELGREGWIDRALEGLDGKPVYLTFDVDYFDPAIMPATGTPEPGGGQWWPTLQLLEQLFRRTTVVASDVVELAPIDGLHHADFTAARLVYKLIGLVAETLQPRVV